MSAVLTQERAALLGLADGALFHKKKGKPVLCPQALAPLADTHGHLTIVRTLDPAVALCRAALVGLRMLVVPVDIVYDVPREWSSVQGLLSWIDAQVEEARALLDACGAQGVVPPAFDAYPEAPGLLDNVLIVAGAHPYGAADLDSEALERLEKLLQSPRCVGVGEIGLDFGPYSDLPSDVQEKAFRTQLRRAHELDLPVELHIRDGEDDTLAHDLAVRILREEGVPRRGCDLHCFTQGPEVMRPFVDLGCHVAFGGAATFARSEDIREAACQCPDGRLLIETDAPYMAPVPLRGQDAEPAMVAFTADLMARTREEAGIAPAAQTYAAQWRNACALLGRTGA